MGVTDGGGKVKINKNQSESYFLVQEWYHNDFFIPLTPREIYTHVTRQNELHEELEYIFIRVLRAKKVT